MNNARRKQIAAIVERLQELRAELDEVENEEQDGFDNMPEGLQQGERGQAMELAVENLGSAGDALDEAISYLEEAQA